MAELDLLPVDELIRHYFSSGSSSRVTYASGAIYDYVRTRVEVEQPTAEDGTTPS